MADGYYTVVTDYGLKEMMKAVQEESRVNITEIAVGDGGGYKCIPKAEAESLQNEVWRGTINSCYISGESKNLLIVESVIPYDMGGFTIREMGVFDDKGGMIAICNTPDTQKAKISDGVLHELNLSMEMELSNSDSVNLIVDPNIVIATKNDIKEMEELLTEKMNTNLGGFSIYPEKLTQAQYDALDSGIKNAPKMLFIITRG